MAKSDMCLTVESKEFNSLRWDDLDLLFMVGQKRQSTADGGPSGEFTYCLKGNGSIEDVLYLAYEVVEYLQEALHENGETRELLDILVKMKKGVMRGKGKIFFGSETAPPRGREH
jgi:hypothetical protein